MWFIKISKEVNLTEQKCDVGNLIVELCSVSKFVLAT